MLIAHGERDERVSPRQSEELVAELRRSGKTFEYVTYPTEAHGFLRAGPQLRLLPPARAVPRLVPDVTEPCTELSKLALALADERGMIARIRSEEGQA